MLGTSVLICTFVKSSAISNNDLGWRGFLPARFILLLWATHVLSERGPHMHLLRVLLAIGVAGVIYDLAILRFYPVLSDIGNAPKIGWLASDQQLGLRTAANREAYEWLAARTPETAVIQQNPEPVYEDTFYGTYGERQTVALGVACGSAFGGDERECASIMPVLAGLFAGSGAQTLESACRALPIDVIVARDTDAAWRDRAGWVWSGKPIFNNGFVRLFACHPHE
jgi:hypothetical protein